MALSGSFQNLVNGNFGVYCEWSGVQNIPNNTTTVTINVYVRHYNINVGDRTGSYNIGGNTGSFYCADIYDMSASSWHYTKIGSCSAVINHSADGTANGKTLSVTYPYRGTYSGTYYENITASTTVNLNQIPRYAVITQSSPAKTETSVTVSWSTDATVDKLWYSTDNGTNYTEVAIAEGTSGTYTISGLTADTEYNIRTKVRRKDSQLESNALLTISTYSYPYASSMPNFMLGNSVTIGIFNPLGRSITVKLLSNDNTVIESKTTSGTSASGFNGSTTVNALYAKIPNAQSGTYKVKCEYSSQSQTRTGGSFAVNPNECSPVIGSLTYQDTNASAVAITGNNQDIVRNHSTVQYTGSSLAGQKSATLASASLTVNGQTYAMTISGSSASGGNAVIDSGTNVTATMTLTDSRGLTSTKSVTVHMLDWTTPTAIVSLARQNNFYTACDLKVDAMYSYINGGNTITITYTGTREDGGATVSGTLSDNVTSVVNMDNDYAWTVSISLVDGFGGTATYTASIARGMPIAFFDRLRNSVSYNCFPTEDYSVEVPSMNLASPQSIYDAIKNLILSDASDIYDAIKTSIHNDEHPVGSIYTSFNSTDPATLFGGTWTRIKDTFLLTAGDTYTAGDTGGSATHTISWDNIPSHSHTGKYINGDGANSGSVKELRVWSASGDGTATITNSVGKGTPDPISNMPPYIVVYAWQRTA